VTLCSSTLFQMGLIAAIWTLSFTRRRNSK